MMVSTKGRYALRVMIDLAEHNNGSYIPLRDIAARQNISEKYLEAVIKSLIKENFLVGMRGKGGGYKLTRSPEDYTVKSILDLTEGSLAPVACLEHEKNLCGRADECPTLPMWRKLDKLVSDFFEGITIAELAGSEIAGNNFVI